MPPKDSNLYGVDNNGRVWCVNAHKNSTWTALPNPTKVDIKRCAAKGGIVWGISSDHQIYVYVPKQDIPIRIREECFENQRWNPVEGFCSHLLPTDRAPFSNEEGTEPKSKKDIKLPSDSWQWENDWQIETSFEEHHLNHEGWTYAVDFPATYHPEKSWKSCVRRRKWFRYRKYAATNRWNRIEPLHADHTQEPFIDVSVGGFGVAYPDVCCLWAISIVGKVYFRKNVTSTNPEGSSWEEIPIPQGLEACQITISANGTPFVVTWTGSCLYRTGLAHHNLSGNEWVEMNGPPGGLLQISAGENSVWAITRDKKCWALKNHFHNVKPTNHEWSEIPGRIKCLSVSHSDRVILALTDEDGSLVTRFGVSPDQVHGQGWKEISTHLSTMSDTVSMTSTASASSELSDSVDGSGDCVSIRPDVPEDTPPLFEPDVESAAIGLCWVDGACVSMLNYNDDGDLEVGPWRDLILQDLHRKREEQQKKFAYPSAMESTSSSWSKSVKAQMFLMSKKSGWSPGQLELSNNDTLVFHRKSHGSWICCVKDVISVLRTADSAFTFMLRIRNAIQNSVADFVMFKFEHEKATEEWRTTICELSEKSEEKFLFANIWLTTSAGEVHKGGQIRMAETPTETEIITPQAGDNLKLHYPLVKGFCPGSELNLDIQLTANCEKFALNLEGRDIIPFHFNPRLSAAIVVRNSYTEDDGWGDEERDGVFPFQPHHSYGVHIMCTEKEIITTITSKHRFIYSFTHRIPPRLITTFKAFGDLSVSKISYNPGSGVESSKIEFVTTPYPGHFWKVATSSSGMVWALGYDMSAWCYRGNAKQKQKNDNENNFMITDEKVFYTYENQRWNPLTNFSARGLPTDRAPWTDETGRVSLEKETFKLPSSDWSWISEWEIDYELNGGCDDEGWQYAIDFPASYHKTKRLNDFVRRRRWKRICRFLTEGPWEPVPDVKLVDICILMNEECEWEVVGVRDNGEAVVRCGISIECPAGEHWDPIPGENHFISISGHFGQKTWAIAKDGHAYIRYHKSWQILDRPKSGPLKSIVVGPSGVWALGNNNHLYVRSNIQPIFPEGTEWTKVCSDVKQVSIAPDGSLWGLVNKKDNWNSHCTLSKRIGVSESNPGGIAWQVVAEGPWRHCSVAGTYSKNPK